jgi:hypothetical protein
MQKLLAPWRRISCDLASRRRLALLLGHTDSHGSTYDGRRCGSVRREWSADAGRPGGPAGLRRGPLSATPILPAACYGGSARVSPQSWSHPRPDTPLGPQLTGRSQYKVSEGPKKNTEKRQT